MNQEPESPDQPKANDTPEPAKAKTSLLGNWKLTKKQAIIFSAIAVVSIGGAAFGTRYYTKPKPVPVDTSVTVPKKTVVKVAPKTTGPTWNDPQKIADPGVFTNLKNYFGGSYDSSLAPEFFKVGSDSGKDIILASVQCNGPCGPMPVLFLNDKPGHYLLLSLHSPDVFDDKGKYDGPDLSSKATMDTTTSYADILYQQSITLDKVAVMNTDKSDKPFSTYQDDKNAPMQHYATTKFGEMLQRTLGKGDGFEVQEFILHRPDAAAVSYQLKPSFVADDNVPHVTWTNGTTNTDAYREDGIGSCGSANGLAVLLAGSQDLQAAGRTNTGETVYEFSNPNNATLQYFYKQYSVDQDGKLVSGAVSLAQYRSNHGVFAYKDALGRYIVFSSMKYGAQAECGKPVIYLYPTQPTNVSVTVDALITKSEPAYGNGWNVLANPNGQLTTGGKSYDSLFWEGTGKQYPSVTSGFVVAQNNLTSTIHSQLLQLGLNNKEASDFMAFWMPRMPKSPYVRLTWFGTKEMNKLAPLHVNPQPDTMIRIFLDFEGLNQPINIPVQHLSAPLRQGFTLVEWGGLLRQ